MYNQSGTSEVFATEEAGLGSPTLCRHRTHQRMSITDTQTEATEQNSIVNTLLGQVTGRLSSNVERVESDLDLDEVFTLLKNSRRRGIIRGLADAEEEITISELAERIAAKEEDVEPDNLTSQARQRVYIPCYQNHLPKLEKHDVVSVDYDRNLVTPCRNHSSLLAVLNRTSTMVE